MGMAQLLEQSHAGRQEQRLRQRFSHGMAISLRYLALPSDRLPDEIARELEGNPFLEQSEEEYDEQVFAPALRLADESSHDIILIGEGWQGGSDSAQGALRYPDDRGGVQFEQTLQDYLREQLPRLQCPSSLEQLACALIDHIDERGYLCYTSAELAQFLDVGIQEVEVVRTIIQSADPAGIAARDTGECLLLQAERVGAGPDVLLAIREGLEFIAARDIHSLAEACGTDDERAYEIAGLVASFHPYPGRLFPSADSSILVFPEAYLHIVDDAVEIRFNSAVIPHLACIGLEGTNAGSVPQKLAELAARARICVDALELRMQTVARLIVFLADYQHGFLCAAEPLRPLSQKELADALSLSPSTICRAIKDKYVLVDGKRLELERLVARAVRGTGGMVSREQAMMLLGQLIDSERKDAPFSDEELSRLLAKRGVAISRKGVAQLRRVMHLPSSYGRCRKG